MRAIRMFMLAGVFLFVAGCSDDDTATILMERFRNDCFPDSSFSGISDTYVYEYNPTNNYQNSMLRIGNITSQHANALLDFNLYGYLPETVKLHRLYLLCLARDRR